MESIQPELNVLIVEDDRYLALALKVRLLAAGFGVRIAETAAKALEAAASEPPDIALLDYNLPDGNGVELMQLLSEDEGTAAVRTIMMTASEQTGLKEDALRLGAVDFFKKPFASNELVDSIRLAVSQTGLVGHSNATINTPKLDESLCAG